MPSVTKHINKDGTISFYVRIFIDQKGDGSQITKTLTWKPELNTRMSEETMKKAAKKWGILQEESYKKGGISTDGSVRFKDYSTRWLETLDIAPLTRETYHFLLVRINEAIGHVRLDKLQPHHIEAFYKELREDGAISNTQAMGKGIEQAMKKQGLTQDKLSALCNVAPATIREARKGNPITLVKAESIAAGLNIPLDKLFKLKELKKPMSKKSIMHIHRLLSEVLNGAKRQRLISCNIASEQINPPKLERKEAKYLSDTQAKQVVELLMNEPDIRIKTSILLLLYSGLRRGELVGLQWNDINFQNNLIHVKRACQYQSKKKATVIVPTKNKSSERSIKLSPFVFHILSQYRSWWSEQKLMHGDVWETVDDNLFIQLNGRPINPNTVGFWIKKFRQTHNLPEFTAHSCRHTFCTLQIAAGVDIRTVQARTGHAHASTLVDIYSHSLDSATEAASNVVDDKLTPIQYREDKNIVQSLDNLLITR